MTETQIENALRLLAKLYSEQNGINTMVEIERKATEDVT